jgi:DNA-binding transcriptional LysR family regulator
MDLRQLEYLVAVVEEGGFRPGARRLRIAQPPVSVAIRHLERELGLTLLERSTRGVVATAAGHELVAHAREILDQMGAARHSVAKYKRPGRTRIRVGVIDRPPVAELTRPVLGAVKRKGIDPALVELPFGNQLEMLLRGDIDVAIVRPPLDHADVEFLPITEEPRCLVVSESHELADEERLSVADILEYPMLGLCAPSEWSSFWQLDEVRGRPLVSEEVPPASTVRAAQDAVARSSATVTMSLSTMRLSSVQGLRAIALEGASPSVTAIARRRGDDRPSVCSFLEIVSETAANAIALLPGGRVPC